MFKFFSKNSKSDKKKSPNKLEQNKDNPNNNNNELLDNAQTDTYVDAHTNTQTNTSKETQTESNNHQASNLNNVDKEKDAPINKKEETQKKENIFEKLKKGLKRTKENFSDQLANLILGKKTIDGDILEEIETCLLMADVGISTTNIIIENLSKMVKRKDLTNPEKLFTTLKEQLTNILTPYEKTINIPSNLNTPFVILMVGVNGSGKTTTIGKLAKQLQNQGKKVMLAAGDTFRAAAIEQLSAWGQRNNVLVVAQKQGSDSASVIYDALQSAKAKQCDVLIADTAGRLHTQDNLMNELKKVIKVIKKLDGNAPHETMLVLDATTGQNALNQAKKFHHDINLSGITITKLDGTAKGGIIFAIANELRLPIRYIGVGEKIDDLRNFDAKAFAKALFNNNS